LGKTKGVLKFGVVVIGLVVAAKVLQNRGLVPSAGGLGTSLQSFISGAKGSESGLETTAPTTTIQEQIAIITEDQPVPTATSGAGGTGAGGTGGGFAGIDPSSVFKQQGFKGLLEQFTLGPGELGFFSSPVNASVRKRLGLQVLGASGIETKGLSITGLRLPPRAKSLSQPTLTGSFTTPTGGTRTIRATPALFKRLQQNLGI